MSSLDDQPPTDGPPITIEVCRRTLDCWTDYKTGKSYPKYHAQIQGEPDYWAAGKWVDETIGKLISCHPERFGVVVEILEGVKR